MIGTTAAIILGASSLAAKAVGSKMASNASKDAAKIQSDASDRALAYNQHATDQSLDFLRTNQDRANAGGPSAPRSALSQLLGIPNGGGSPVFGSGPMAGGVAMSYGGPQGGNTGITGSGAPRSPLTMPGQSAGDGMVLMQAPGGQTRRVKQQDVDHYKQAIGARVIG